MLVDSWQTLTATIWTSAGDACSLCSCLRSSRFCTLQQPVATCCWHMPAADIAALCYCTLMCVQSMACSTFSICLSGCSFIMRAAQPVGALLNQPFAEKYLMKYVMLPVCDLNGSVAPSISLQTWSMMTLNAEAVALSPGSKSQGQADLDHLDAALGCSLRRVDSHRVTKCFRCGDCACSAICTRSACDFNLACIANCEVDTMFRSGPGH